MKNKDILIIGLLFTLLIQFGVSIKNSYHLSKLEKDLKDTVEVVYWLNDKLEIAYSNIDYLNEEITNNWKELDEYRTKDKFLKDLARYR